MGVIRTNITQVQAYVAGKPIDETKRELGLRSVIKLASNENPLGVSPKAVAAMKKAIGQVNRYPDSQGFYLKQKLSGKLGVPKDAVVLGNGSDELIDILIKTFVEDGEEVLTADTTFVEYAIISRINNKKLVTVPLKDYRFDLAAMKARVSERTKLIFIANPNNPTGTYVSRSELESFCAGLPQNAIVVLDEAYDAFIDVDDYPSGISYLGKKNIITLKTFSKGYGLAGVRIGYCVADPQWSTYLERTRQPFNVNSIAQAAAIAALDDGRFLKRTREVTLEGKYYFYKQFQAMGLSYVPSLTNFVLVDTGRDCLEVFKALLKLGVIVRDMKQYNLNTCVRVSIGTMAENKLFIQALKKVLGKAGER
jgi:histidinol-phosphate aminotransferase